MIPCGDREKAMNGGCRQPLEARKDMDTDFPLEFTRGTQPWKIRFELLMSRTVRMCLCHLKTVYGNSLQQAKETHRDVQMVSPNLISAGHTHNAHLTSKVILEGRSFGGGKEFS